MPKNEWLSKADYIAKLKAEGKYNPQKYFANKDKKNSNSTEIDFNDEARCNELTKDQKIENFEYEIKQLKEKLTKSSSKDSEYIKELQEKDREIEFLREQMKESCSLDKDKLNNEIQNLRINNTQLQQELNGTKSSLGTYIKAYEEYSEYADTFIEYLKQFNPNIQAAINAAIHLRHECDIYKTCTDGSYECAYQVGTSKYNENFVDGKSEIEASVAKVIYKIYMYNKKD